MEGNVRMERSVGHKGIVLSGMPIARVYQSVGVRITGIALVEVTVFLRIRLPVVLHEATMAAETRVSQSTVETLPLRMALEKSVMMACNVQMGVVVLLPFPVQMDLPAHPEVAMVALQVV